MPLGSREEYRRCAAECVELAQRVRAGERKHLLEIAFAWLKLADSTEDFPAPAC